MIRLRGYAGLANRIARCAGAIILVACGHGPHALAASAPSAAVDGMPRATSTVVTLERKPCYGSCPVYTLSIASDGVVTFDGRAHVDLAHRVTARIDPKEVSALLQFFDSSQFSTLDDRYGFGEANCRNYAADAPIVIVSLMTDGRTKRVEHDAGCEGVPARLAELERRIDATAKVWRWTTGKPP